MAEERINSVYDLLRREYGVEVEGQSDPVTATVGTSAVAIAKNDPRRVALVVVNLSANTIYLRPLGTPSSSSGIVLTPSGGIMALNWREDLHLPSLEWQAVASGAASAILVLSVLVGRV